MPLGMWSGAGGEERGKRRLCVERGRKRTKYKIAVVPTPSTSYFEVQNKRKRSFDLSPGSSVPVPCSIDEKKSKNHTHIV